METTYHKIPAYTMKCRLYPNKSQSKAIDDILWGVQLYYNGLIYDMFFNHVNTKEKASKEDGTPLHWPDVNSAFTAAYKKTLIEKFPAIDCVPAAALTTNVGLKSDVQRMFKKDKKPLEWQKPRFYRADRPRSSYTYQIAFSQIRPTENPNVFRVALTNTGVKPDGKLCASEVKLRGVNQKLRFDEAGTVDFAAYLQQAPQEKLTITVSKDNCGDYYICFKLTDCVYKAVPESGENVCGVDVGIKDIAIVSDGTKYPNSGFKKQQKRHQRRLNRQLSRRQGWSNEEFRAANKGKRGVTVSKGYLHTRRKLALLQRKIARKREHDHHQISYEIVTRHSFIGVESLNVQGMTRNRHLAYALTDAGMGQLLSMIAYKAGWYGRIEQPIDQWTPSSKRCSSCKDYIYRDLTLAVRKWTCPVCGAHHDRDINAAKNIRDYAIEAFSGLAGA